MCNSLWGRQIPGDQVFKFKKKIEKNTEVKKKKKKKKKKGTKDALNPFTCQSHIFDIEHSNWTPSLETHSL
jgi:hypothetical protein